MNPGKKYCIRLQWQTQRNIYVTSFELYFLDKIMETLAARVLISTRKNKGNDLNCIGMGHHGPYVY